MFPTKYDIYIEEKLKPEIRDLAIQLNKLDMCKFDYHCDFLIESDKIKTLSERDFGEALEALAYVDELKEHLEYFFQQSPLLKPGRNFECKYCAFNDKCACDIFYFETRDGSKINEAFTLALSSLNHIKRAILFTTCHNKGPHICECSSKEKY